MLDLRPAWSACPFVSPLLSQAGYYLVADPVRAVETCKPCAATWFQGREGTDCKEPGITLETLPIRPGFFRQSLTAQVVRKCINIDADAACLGTSNSSLVEVSVAKQEMTLNIDIDQFNATAVREKLSILYNISVDLIQLTVEAGSLQLMVTVKAPEGSSIDATTASINAVDSGMLGFELGATAVAPVEQSTVEEMPVVESVCGVGYTGPCVTQGSKAAARHAASLPPECCCVPPECCCVPPECCCVPPGCC